MKRNTLMLASIFLLAFFDLYGAKEKKYRIAFVKQVVYQDLYCTNAKNPADIVFSTFRRSGPIALFSALNADFIIVDTEPDPECQIWKEKAIHQKGIEYYESLKTSIPPEGLLAGHLHPQGFYAVSCSSIDWSKYDIVISMDIAVPERIVKKYPKTLWAYYIGEGMQPSYRSSYEKPLAGYDVFLTQDFHVANELNPHVIDFPYHLHYYGCIHELLGISPSYPRSGIFLDVHTNVALSENQKNQLHQYAPLNIKPVSFESYKSMIERLITTKYFIVFLKTQRKHRTFLHGNAIPEAVAAGNLVIAQQKCLKNSSLLSPSTTVNSFHELIERIIYFEQHPTIYAEELTLQQKKLNMYCYERPIRELYKHYEQKKAHTSH